MKKFIAGKDAVVELKKTVEEQRRLTGHKTDGVHARYTHLETETLREAINKLPPIPD